jgi:hypothetical protein
MPALNSWLDTPLGQHVLAREQAYFDQAVADVFGYHAVQFGLPDQPLLRENRMPWRCRAGESGAVDVTCDPAALPFASQIIASDNDPYCAAARADALARQWGSALTVLHAAGHINTDAGFGPWPEGLTALADWLATLPLANP